MPNLARTIPTSAVNGPGERFVIWVQGCSLHCPGCWNPDTWSHRARFEVDAQEIAETIISTQGIEGITLTGGEPFEQAAELLPLVDRVREAGLSVMIFTGFELDQLHSEAHRGLLAGCDVLVAGPYRRRERSLGLTWRGSSNQTVHFLTDRYGAESMRDAQECEVYVSSDGSLAVTGFPPDDLLQ